MDHEDLSQEINQRLEKIADLPVTIVLTNQEIATVSMILKQSLDHGMRSPNAASALGKLMSAAMDEAKKVSLNEPVPEPVWPEEFEADE